MKSALLAATFLLSISTVAFAGTISSPADGETISLWGDTGAQANASPTYGHTFTAPGGNLQSFSFTITVNSADPLTYQAYLYGWPAHWHFFPAASASASSSPS